MISTDFVESWRCGDRTQLCCTPQICNADACKLRIIRENFIKLFFEQQGVTCSRSEDFARHEDTTRKDMAFTSIIEEESRVTTAGGGGVAKWPMATSAS
ncbi:hypothetical protein DVH05_027439 [Phytophthora capsici]|nr:hypothetical protein DVH05_027439 [Phytophthora capsici]|eukprot:jgi/Phyca11/509159/fgenesh2_kg.PHYCAscaffold_42_\